MVCLAPMPSRMFMPLMQDHLNDEHNLQTFVMKIGCLGLPPQIGTAHCASTRPPAADGQ